MFQHQRRHFVRQITLALFVLGGLQSGIARASSDPFCSERPRLIIFGQDREPLFGQNREPLIKLPVVQNLREKLRDRTQALFGSDDGLFSSHPRPLRNRLFPPDDVRGARSVAVPKVAPADVPSAPSTQFASDHLSDGDSGALRTVMVRINQTIPEGSVPCREHADAPTPAESR